MLSGGQQGGGLGAQGRGGIEAKEISQRRGELVLVCARVAR